MADEAPAARVTPDRSAQPASLLSVGRGMAIGVLASRVTGFGRVVVLSAALGLGTELFDSYNVANTMPNVAYELLFGGLATSLVVPMVSRAILRDRTAGIVYAQRLLLVVTAGLTGVVALSMAVAPMLVELLSPGMSPDQHHFAVALSWFFLPQIALYGIGATGAAVLNSLSGHSAPMWAPAVNNVIVILVGIAYITVGGTTDLREMSTPQKLLLGAGTTAGVAGQVLVILWTLRRQGFFTRLRHRGTGMELRRTVRLGAWVLLSVAANQSAYTMAIRSASHLGQGAVSAYQTGFAVFHVPYAVAAVSVNTAVLPRLSRAAAIHDDDDLVANVSRSIRLILFVTAPAGATLFALGPAMSDLLFAHGNSILAAVELVAMTVRTFGFAVVPFAIYAAFLTAFNALQDTRTAALLNLLVGAVAVAGFAASAEFLPDRKALAGLPATYVVAYSSGCLVAGMLLNRRLCRARSRITVLSHVRILFAALSAGAAEVVVLNVLRTLAGYASVFIAVSAGAIVYLFVAGELRRAVEWAARRIGRTRISPV